MEDFFMPQVQGHTKSNSEANSQIKTNSRPPRGHKSFPQTKSTLAICNNGSQGL
jgi:hypothetical protein